MNISQHCFVPRGKELKGKYYSLNGTLTPSTTAGLTTTEIQTGDVYNSFQLFGSYTPAGSWYALRLFEPAEGSSTPVQGRNYVGSSNNGYISPDIKFFNSVIYTSSAYTYSSLQYTGFPVVCVMWYEIPSPALNLLSLGSTFTPDVIDDEEEAL